MNRTRQSVAVLAFVVVGLVGCAHESNSMSAPHPVNAADMQGALRDEGSLHFFWIRNVVLGNANNAFRSRDFAEKAVATNARDLARTLTPVHGEAASYRLHTLLTKHSGPVKAYSLATVAGDKEQQDSAMTLFASNTDEIATFVSEINPHLSKDVVRDLFATHVDYHVAQIITFQARDSVGEEESWSGMQHHIYDIADTLTAALAKQFPAKLSQATHDSGALSAQWNDFHETRRVT